MRDKIFYMILNFNKEFNIHPTHIILTIHDYRKIFLLDEYLPSNRAKDYKETLFGLDIIVTNIAESKCAVLFWHIK